MKILVVCLGNICRSPMAHGILENLVKIENLDWEIDSAGTESFHVGEPPHPSSRQVCLENGIDLSNQCARKFVKSDVDKFDKIYAMANDVFSEMKQIAGNKFDASKMHLFLEELYPGEKKSVTDPWYGGHDGYYAVFNEIERCCKQIVERYK